MAFCEVLKNDLAFLLGEDEQIDQNTDKDNLF